MHFLFSIFVSYRQCQFKLLTVYYHTISLLYVCRSECSFYYHRYFIPILVISSTMKERRENIGDKFQIADNHFKEQLLLSNLKYRYTGGKPEYGHEFNRRKMVNIHDLKAHVYFHSLKWEIFQYIASALNRIRWYLA